jgi:predicted NAD-dependent protein-ADP-ribosyltransferase YbiA (DUF1768 family)
MSRWRKTYRTVDDQQIAGTWRPIFIRNGNYYLTELYIYADGVINCWENVTLDGLREKIRAGWVATALPSGALASVHDLASWKFAEPQMWLTGDQLLGEVADEIDRLNERPDSTGRLHEAIRAYVADPSEEHRLEVRDRYEAVPEHHRLYVLGDMDRKDFPVRVVIANDGDVIEQYSDDGSVVTPELRRKMIEYFVQQQESWARFEPKLTADGPETADAATVTLVQKAFPRGWPADPGLLVLRNEYPAPIRLGDQVFPSVTHAYWALSVSDRSTAAEIANAERPYDAQELGKAADRRPDWTIQRVAVMAELLRAKFGQDPELAEVLLGTDDAMITYQQISAKFWSSEGRNWLGRLLELIRSELAARSLLRDL